MKTKTLFYMALTAMMTTLAACSQDDELMDAAPKATPIEFEIFDGGYGGDEATRAVEEGLRTKFEAGDECGLYIIDDGEFIASNVKLTAEEGENGEITWKAADGAISGVTENSKYFLYYPYVSYADSRVGNASGDKDTEVFKELIANWSVYHIQSTYTSYTQSDLMTATGTPSPETDDKLKVSFRLTHRMALAIIEVPRTVYKFTDTSIPDYVPTLVDFTVGDNFLLPYRMADGTYRCIVNPIEETYSDRCITGTITGNKKFTIPSEKLKGIDKEKYTRFVVGGGAVTEINHNLQAGDYLLKDGNLISKDETLTAVQKADVAAIVFYAPNISERETPASLTDDKIMAAEHPNCNHGLAVAVQELTYQGSNTMAWQTKAENVKYFRKKSNFTHANKDNFVSIASGTTSSDNISKIYGYQNTQVLFAYNDYCTKNSKTDNIVKPAAAIAGFTDANPAPTGSTGWFIPSAKELHILCYKDVDKVFDNGKNHTVTRDKVNESLTAVGGVVFGDGWYWSSSEFNNSDNSQFCADFSDASFSNPEKTTGYLVRYVCAF